MKYVMALAMASLMFAVTGCVFVRPKAASVLKLQPDPGKPESIAIGFRDVKWAVIDGKSIVVGYGWHGSEHETYAFFMSEPLYHKPRWFIVRPSENSVEYTIQLLWPYGGSPLSREYSGEPVEYRGQVQSVQWTEDRKLKLSLRDVTLWSSKGTSRISLSGHIVATPDSPEHLRRALKSAEETRAKAAEQ